MLRVQVRGVDEAPVLRPGDISPTGLYVETPQDMGALGSVCTLVVADEDGGRALSVLARVVRRTHAQDLWAGQLLTGTAFHFMAETEDKQRAVDALVQHVMARALRDAAAARAGVPQGAVSRVSGVVVLDAAWGMVAGQEVHVRVESVDGTRSVALRAVVAASAPVVTGGAVATRTTLRMMGPEQPVQEVAVKGASMEEALGALADQVELEESAEAQRERLAGVLGVVSLQGIVSFLELQRMSGMLGVAGPAGRAFIHVRAGRVVDAELPGSTSDDAGALVVEVLRWTDGTFEFTPDDSARVDRVARPTMELLLDAARLSDEAVTTPTDF